MKIGILQTGHAPDAVQADGGDYPAMFARILDGQGFEFQTYDVTAMQFPAAPDDCDGWIITGSRHGAYEPHPWIAPLEQLIRDIYAAHRPLVGVCFGHQIIAQALGGTVEKFSGGWSAGKVDYQFDDGRTMAMNAWHQDQVTRLPKGARTIARSDFCEHAALVYGDDILTIQPHPEFDGTTIGHLIDIRGALLPSDVLDRARAGLDQPTDAGDFANQMAQFLKRGAK